MSNNGFHLYEFDERLLDYIDQETGEVIDIEGLDALQMEFNEKALNLGCWIKDLEAEKEAIKTEKNNLAKRQTVCENKIEQLKNYLSRVLNGMKLKDARCSISYRKSVSVEVDDSVIDKLPEEYIKVEKSVRKTELKDAMKLGFEFEGCRLIEKSNIQIR